LRVYAICLSPDEAIRLEIARYRQAPRPLATTISKVPLDIGSPPFSLLNSTNSMPPIARQCKRRARIAGPIAWTGALV